MGAARHTFQPTITASAWRTVWQATRAAAERRHGTDGVDPKLSNADAVALVAAWTRRISPARFRLWYQFAAAAYGWDPKRRDVLDASARQRAAIMPALLSRELWSATEEIARTLAREKPDEPRLDVDDGVFDDPVFQASVKACLVEDGAVARVRPRRRRKQVGDMGKIPLCAKPKLGCRPGFKLVQASPGVFVCQNQQTGEVEQPSLQCDEVVLIDDPLTFAGDQFIKLALLVVGAVIVANVIATEGVRRSRR